MNRVFVFLTALVSFVPPLSLQAGPEYVKAVLDLSGTNVLDDIEGASRSPQKATIQRVQINVSNAQVDVKRFIEKLKNLLCSLPNVEHIVIDLYNSGFQLNATGAATIDLRSLQKLKIIDFIEPSGVHLVELEADWLIVRPDFILDYSAPLYMWTWIRPAKDTSYR